MIDISDCVIAADDLVCSLEETITKRREKSLYEMRQKISTLIEDLGHCHAVYGSIALSVNEVTVAKTGLQTQFNAVFAPTLPTDVQPENIQTLAGDMAKNLERVIRVSNWGLTGYWWAVAASLYAQHGSRLAQLAIQSSQATVLGTIGQAAGNSRLMVRPATLTSQTSHLTKIGRWLEVLGAIATVANGVVVVIDAVMAAREVANMRHQVAALKTSLRTLEDEVTKMDKAFAELAEFGSILYLATSGGDTVIDGYQPELTISGMFQKVKELPKLLSGDPVTHQKFHELRVELNRDNIRLRSCLQNKIQQQMLDLRLWQEQVESACLMLVDQIELDKVKRALPKLSDPLLHMLTEHVNAATGDERLKPRISLSAGGEVKILQSRQ